MTQSTHRPTWTTGLVQLLTVIALATAALVLTTTLTSDETTEVEARERFGKTAQSTPDLRPAPDVSVDEGPTHRLERLGLAPDAVDRSKAFDDAEPTGFDVRNPPQWTESLARPAEHPVAPDPFEPSTWTVDPTRRSTAETTRRSDY